jgi:conjugative relaxase-like TrwC/TraI family protein
VGTLRAGVGTIVGTPAGDSAEHVRRFERRHPTRPCRVGRGRVVLRFKTFGSARAAVRYYVERGADCARIDPPPCTGLETAEDCGMARAVDYYGQSGRSVGVWFGSGAGALGLSGPIRPEQVEVLERLLSGQLPDGTGVAAPVWRPHPDSRLPVGPLLDAIELARTAGGDVSGDRDLAGVAQLARVSDRLARDPKATAKLTDLETIATSFGVRLDDVYGAGRVAVAHAQSEVQVDVRRAGADGAVSAPKSVSLLWALSNPDVSSEVLAAHRAAVAETVDYLQRWASHALRGHQGDGQRAAHQVTDGLIVAGFEHLTSRADDPQIHTHLVVANLLHGQDGKWSALDTRALFRAQRTAGYLYQAVLRGQLTDRLGLEWGPVRNGTAEIVGIPTGLRREFSTRRIQIEAHLQQTGGHGAAAAQVACLATRPAKSGRTVTELAAGWRARAAASTRDPNQLIAATLGRTRAAPLDPQAITAAADRLFGPDGVTRHASSFDRADLTRALLEALPAGTPLTHRQTEQAVDRLLTDPRALPLVDGGEARRWTTVELASTELATLRLAEHPTLVPTREPVTADGVSTAQHSAVVAIAASPAAVDVVLGPAGAGKTAMLAALHDHYQALGVPVLGGCVAAVTARRLEHATAIPSTSIARLVARIRDGQPLPDRCVLVIDEAGMVGTRDYHQLLHAVTAAGGKLIGVGDRAQLTEIDAGGMFARLSRGHLRVELTDNHRQRHGWERAALTLLRAGNVPQALDVYQRRGRLHHHHHPEQVTDAIARRYLDILQHGVPVSEIVALAATRTGAATLNHAIRHQLQTTGLIGADQPAGNESYAVGEHVMVTRNDHQRGLLNGQRARITAVTPAQVTMQVDGQQDVTVPAGWANDRLTGAYALTIHKAQGLTVDIALVDATGLTDRNTGYVALSRARHATEIHHTSSRELAHALHDDPFTDRAQHRHPISQLAGRLQQQREKELATDLHPQWYRPPPAGREGLSR